MRGGRCATGGVKRAAGVARRRSLRAEVRRGEGSEHEGGSNSVVESQPSKLLVAGSIPVSRSNLRPRDASYGLSTVARGAKVEGGARN